MFEGKKRDKTRVVSANVMVNFKHRFPNIDFLGDRWYEAYFFLFPVIRNPEPQ